MNYDFSYITLEGCLEDQVQVVITLQSIRDDTDGAETYCGVIALAQLRGNAGRNGVSVWNGLLRRWWANCLWRSCWAGFGLDASAPGRPDQLMKSVFHRLQVTGSIGTADFDHGRWSAWSNLIGGKAQRPGGHINLEFGYRYEPSADQTRIALATPALPGYF